MGDRALIVLSALLAIHLVLFAYRLKRPIFFSVAVEALDAVGVLVAGATFLVTDADFLTVTTLALASNGAGPARVQLLLQVVGILAVSRFLLLFDSGGIAVYARTKRQRYRV